MTTICITGCLGFLGKHLTLKCLEKGWNVVGIDKGTYCADLDMVEYFMNTGKFVFIPDDIKDLTRIPRCKYFVNTAAESHVANSIINSRPFIDSNIEGVINILKLINDTSESDKPVFLHVSTDEVYGDIVEGLFTEESPLNPSNPYAFSKAAADLAILTWARTYGVKYNIIRPTNYYGSSQYPEKLVPICVERLHEGQKILLHNNGTPVRTWLHVDDACDAILTILERGKRNEIYNCSGGVEKTNREVVEKIIKAYYENTEMKSSYLAYIDYSYNRPGQDVRYALDDKKLKSLGWKPTKNFDEEIVKIVRMHKHQLENGKFQI